MRSSRAAAAARGMGRACSLRGGASAQGTRPPVGGRSSAEGGAGVRGAGTQRMRWSGLGPAPASGPQAPSYHGPGNGSLRGGPCGPGAVTQQWRGSQRRLRPECVVISTRCARLLPGCSRTRGSAHARCALPAGWLLDRALPLLTGVIPVKGPSLGTSPAAAPGQSTRALAPVAVAELALQKRWPAAHSLIPAGSCSGTQSRD